MTVSTIAGQAVTAALPAYIAKMPRIFPHRATVPLAVGKAVDPAMNAAGGRLAVTESDTADRMWVWARTKADAEAATAATPTLVFAEVPR